MLVLTSLITLVSFSFKQKTQDPQVPYPEGYRMWTHVKTGLVGPSNPGFRFNGGFHHIYANALAMQGYTTGHFPNGSILVFDVIDMKEENGNTLEAGRNHVDVMVKDSLKYASTGGWGYEEFKGDSHTQRLLTTAAKNQCYTCHTQQAGFVFSVLRN
ncbi:cytochrome P460 family protein [Paraflavitalea speifideaquila]|uniref:cytochrome P460 family protein n=1 Tax=Paraflavitalea speifideaquila TaxID=3076558 RepID=UPI0028E6EDD2|nr:cytochrome P460 family protein [Paraflavitalea speifideiaquila]